MSVSSALPPAGYGLTCARSPPSWTRSRSANCAAGCACVRIRAKLCRYAAEAVAPVFGRQAGRFAAAISAVQAIPGDHQDTVMAEAWLRATGAGETP